MLIVKLLVIWNVAVFLIFGIDKYCAVKNKWRISEKALIICAFLMGAAGAFIGMRVFHHKTKKRLFRVMIPAAFLVDLIVILLWERM